MPIHTLRKLGENESGDKAGIELPRAELRRLGCIDGDGNLVYRPNVAIDYDPDADVFRLAVLDGESLA